MSDIKVVKSGNVIELYEYENDYFESFSDFFKYGGGDLGGERSDRLSSSRSRTKKRIRRLIHCNVGAYGYKPILITYTFKNNVTDISQANYCFRLFSQRFHRYIRGKGYNSLKYISVVEFQKRGAVHYHVIYFNLPYIEGIKGDVASLWGHGFVQVKAVKYPDRIGSYLTKYLTKTLGDSRLCGKKAYSSSQGLIKPQEIKIAHSELSPHLLNNVVEYDKVKRVRVVNYPIGSYGTVKYTLFHKDIT